MNADDFNDGTLSSFDERRSVGLRRLVLPMLGLGAAGLLVFLVGPRVPQLSSTKKDVAPSGSRSTRASQDSSSTTTTVANQSTAREAPGLAFEPLSSDLQRAHWSNPTDSQLWQSTGWTFAEASMESSPTGASTATFRQPFTAMSASTSFAISAPTTESDSALAAPLLKLVLLDTHGRAQIGMEITSERAALLLNAGDGVDRIVVREVPVTVAFGTGYLRVVLTRDRLLTFLDERVLWNVARPEALVNQQFFVTLDASQRAVTLSELRFDSSE